MSQQYAEKEKDEKISELNDIAAEKDEQLKQIKFELWHREKDAIVERTKLRQKEEKISKLNDIAAEKDEQLKQKKEEVSDLNEQLHETKEKLSQLNHLMAEKEEQLQWKNKETSELKTQVFKNKGQLFFKEADIKVEKRRFHQKDEEMKKKQSLLNEEVKSANARTEEAKSQCELLKEQIASLKAASDLQIKTMKTDFKRKIKNIKNQLDEKTESSKISASCFFSFLSPPGDLIKKKKGPAPSVERLTG